MRKLMSFVTGMIACLLLLLVLSAPIFAQVGIFGGVPKPNSNIGLVRRVKIQGTNTLGQTVNVSYPLNGILNYVAYFDALNGGTAKEYFLFEGTYTLTYLDASGSPIIPIGLSTSTEGPFNYVPNAGFTNGFQVASNNPGAGGALGIQGFVKDSSGNGIFNAIVEITSAVGTGIPVYRTRTNANGFYSLYYDNATPNKGFIPSAPYALTVTKLVQAGCTKTFSPSSFVNYSPTNTTNPSLSSYFVTGAAVTVPTVTFNTNVCP